MAPAILEKIGVLENFNQTHAETDYLLSYPDETGFTVEQESEIMQSWNMKIWKQQLIVLLTGVWKKMYWMIF